MKCVLSSLIQCCEKTPNTFLSSCQKLFQGFKRNLKENKGNSSQHRIHVLNDFEAKKVMKYQPEYSPYPAGADVQAAKEGHCHPCCRVVSPSFSSIPAPIVHFLTLQILENNGVYRLLTSLKQTREKVKKKSRTEAAVLGYSEEQL